MCDASRMGKVCGIVWDKLGYIWDKRCNGLFILIIYTTYAVARLWSGFCLPFDCAQDERQHGTSHALCADFPRSARKIRTLTEIKYRSAEGGVGD